ncbi:hypothetical protein BJX66DRAFT_263947 [Aspergillus keveii]|uniref:Uncharacterized protein n=1 Tax=Aspergillus keveii TaxID=714993 RepID=A0ABR4FXY2_9EURO
MSLQSAFAGSNRRRFTANNPWMQPLHNDSTLQRQYNRRLSAADCCDIGCSRSLFKQDLLLHCSQVTPRHMHSVNMVLGFILRTVCRWQHHSGSPLSSVKKRPLYQGTCNEYEGMVQRGNVLNY